MAKKKQLIIPIFIPNSGCPHQCVFCNQSIITGKDQFPNAIDVVNTINTYLDTWKGSGKKEIAFYGGSFTGLDRNLQKIFLDTAYRFVSTGLIDSIRISTRPDYITNDCLEFLKRYQVEIVELGAQSMTDEVLKLSGRGHTARDTSIAVKLLKEYGLKVGLQLMPGLPGDSIDSILYTSKKVIELNPDFVRIYPAIVIRDTPLEKLYLSGLYKPWSLTDMIDICRKMVALFHANGIPIIKIGLQSGEALKQGIVAGPYHQSFRSILGTDSKFV